jgi:hypothetical protein
MASTGHSSTQTPQSTHLSASITALSSTISIASLGQQSTHAPQPVQVPLSTIAGIFIPFQKLITMFYKQVREFTYFRKVKQSFFLKFLKK